MIRREQPLIVKLPHPHYKPYNKSNAKIVYSEPDQMVYWRNDGEAVITFEKSGNWYLRGVGGQPFFEREGLTWQLISSRLKTRYLPSGYILDSGSPCGFLRPGDRPRRIVFHSRLDLSPLCSRILKSVINHTMNIQSKDFERLPYPHWISAEKKKTAVNYMKELIEHAKRGRLYSFDSEEIVKLGNMFEMNE